MFEGTPVVLPTAQEMSEVGKRVKSAVEQEGHARRSPEPRFGQGKEHEVEI